jgi:hypothetical protein
MSPLLCYYWRIEFEGTHMQRFQGILLCLIGIVPFASLNYAVVMQWRSVLTVLRPAGHSTIWEFICIGISLLLMAAAGFALMRTARIRQAHGELLIGGCMLLVAGCIAGAFVQEAFSCIGQVPTKCD